MCLCRFLLWHLHNSAGSALGSLPNKVLEHLDRLAHVNSQQGVQARTHDEGPMLNVSSAQPVTTGCPQYPVTVLGDSKFCHPASYDGFPHKMVRVTLFNLMKNIGVCAQGLHGGCYHCRSYLCSLLMAFSRETLSSMSPIDSRKAGSIQPADSIFFYFFPSFSFAIYIFRAARMFIFRNKKKDLIPTSVHCTAQIQKLMQLKFDSVASRPVKINLCCLTIKDKY